MLQTKSATAGGAGRWQRSTVSNPDKYTDILSDAGHSWFHLLYKLLTVMHALILKFLILKKSK